MSVLPNKDQAEGEVKQATGRAEEAAGAVTGDNETRAEGVGKQVEGKIQEGLGDVKKAIHNATR